MAPPAPLRVAVLGARGRMGSEVCRAVRAADGLELVDVDGYDATGARVADPAAAVVASGAQVAVDFTTPDAVMGNLRTLVAGGVHAVVGTSGFDEERLAQLREQLAAAPGVGVVVAPNFGLGAVLMTRFAREAAPLTAGRAGTPGRR